MERIWNNSGLPSHFSQQRGHQQRTALKKKRRQSKGINSNPAKIIPSSYQKHSSKHKNPPHHIWEQNFKHIVSETMFYRAMDFYLASASSHIALFLSSALWFGSLSFSPQKAQTVLLDVGGYSSRISFLFPNIIHDFKYVGKFFGKAAKQNCDPFATDWID